MKEKILINARIIDPSQKIDEKGSVIIDENGKIKHIGKNVKKSDSSSSAEVFDLKKGPIKLNKEEKIFLLSLIPNIRPTKKNK